MPTKIEELTFYTVEEVADKFRVTPQTIRSYIRKGKLRAARIGRPLLITSKALEEFTEGNLRAEAVDGMTDEEFFQQLEAAKSKRLGLEADEAEEKYLLPDGTPADEATVLLAQRFAKALKEPYLKELREKELERARRVRQGLPVEDEDEAA